MAQSILQFQYFHFQLIKQLYFKFFLFSLRFILFIINRKQMKKSLSISAITKRDLNHQKTPKRGLAVSSKEYRRKLNNKRQKTILAKYFNQQGQLKEICETFQQPKSSQIFCYPSNHQYLQYHRKQIGNDTELLKMNFLQQILEVQIIDTNTDKPLFEIGCCQDNSVKSIKCLCIINNKNQLFINDIYSTKRIAYINFNTVSCAIVTTQFRKFNEMNGKNYFNESITIKKKQYKLDFNGKLIITFDSQNQQYLEQFFDYVKKIIQKSHGYQNRLIEISSIPKFYQKKYILEQQFFQQCQTGDLILFESKNFMSKFQRYFTNSEFDHVAMIIKDDIFNVLLYESNGLSGVCMTPWQFIASNHYSSAFNKIVWRKLKGVQRDFKFKKNLKKFILANLQTKYHFSLGKLLTNDKDYEKSSTSKQNGYFCSQLIAFVYKQLKLLPENDYELHYKLACQYLPYDFTDKANLKLKNGAKLSESHEIVIGKRQNVEESLIAQSLLKMTSN